MPAANADLGEVLPVEFATASPASHCGEPFDEPHVKEAKDQTAGVLRTHAAAGRLDVSRLPRRQPTSARRSTRCTRAPTSFLSICRRTAVATALQRIRVDIRRRHQVATTVGIDLPALHRQYHKGGAPGGLQSC
jgi:hypothetical protein